MIDLQFHGVVSAVLNDVKMIYPPNQAPVWTAQLCIMTKANMAVLTLYAKSFVSFQQFVIFKDEDNDVMCAPTTLMVNIHFVEGIEVKAKHGSTTKWTDVIIKTESGDCEITMFNDLEKVAADAVIYNGKQEAVA